MKEIVFWVIIAVVVLSLLNLVFKFGKLAIVIAILVGVAGPIISNMPQIQALIEQLQNRTPFT